MTADETLRRAAEKLREVAGEAAQPENSHPYGDKTLPPATSPEDFGRLMREYLGGPWGELAATMHPGVADALADWLDTLARLHETGDTGGPLNTERALAVARQVLGEDVR